MKILAMPSITSLSSEDLNSFILNADQGQSNSILSEIERRNKIGSLSSFLLNPKLVTSETLIKASQILFKNISNTPIDISLYVLKNILKHSDLIDDHVESNLYNIAMSGPKLCAYIFINKDTSSNLITKILNKVTLNNTIVANVQKPYVEKMTSLTDYATNTLHAILELLKNDSEWGNKTSSLLLISRLVQSPQDEFWNEASKHSINAESLPPLENAAKLKNNSTIVKNIQENDSLEVALYNAMKQHDINEATQVILSIINKQSSDNYEMIANKLLDTILNFDNKRVLAHVVKYNLEIFEFLYHHSNRKNKIEFIKSIAMMKAESLYSDVINEILASNDIELQETLIDNVDYNWFSPIALDLNTKNKLKKYYYNKHNPTQSIAPQTEIDYSLSDDDLNVADEELPDPFAKKSNANWYLKYSSDLNKEAGKTNQLLFALALAVNLVMGGMAIKNAADKANVKEEQLQRVLDDKRMTTYVLQLQNEIMKNEGAQQMQQNDNPNQPQLPSKPTYSTTPPSFNDLKTMLEDHEGREYSVYYVNKIPHIGIGFNLTKENAKQLLANVGVNINDVLYRKKKLTDEQIDALFKEDLKLAILSARQHFTNMLDLPTEIQKVLTDMSFNLGPSKITDFKKLKEALLNFNYSRAKKEMINSDWYSQVGRRSKALTNIVDKYIIANPSQSAKKH